MTTTVWGNLVSNGDVKNNLTNAKLKTKMFVLDANAILMITNGGIGHMVFSCKVRDLKAHRRE